MDKYVITMVVKGKRTQVYIGSQNAASAFATAKILYPDAFVLKAEKTTISR